MTAPVRATVPVLAPAAVTAGTFTKAAPALTGPWVDIRAHNGGDIGISVKNGPSAPGIQGQFTVQVADDNAGTNVFDLGSAGGNTTANAEATHLWPVPSTASYIRILGYGNTTNDVTLKATMFAKA